MTSIARFADFGLQKETMSNEEETVQPDNEDSSPSGIQIDTVSSFACPECKTTIDVQSLEPFSDVACPECGLVSPVPARLSNFLLLRLMGTGGMGGVYFARDETLGRFVAIKVMLQSLGDDPEFIENFRREAQAIAKLNHPNIAQIYSFGQEKGQPYIVMELVSGDRVDVMMEDPNGIAPAKVMRIGLEIALGLSAADEAGLVHGDIKPENILMDAKGQAKLVDFGLATVAHQAAGEGIWGTPYYIAPEKIRRQKVDARSDIYSLGATLYHMLTGNPPFEGETPVEVVKARLEQPPPDPRTLMPELPEIVASTIQRMLAVERTERYPNYLSLISDLRKAVHELNADKSVSSQLSASRGSGKKIRFKKRKGGAPSTSQETPVRTETEAIADTDASPRKGKKLVLRKKGGKAILRQPSTTGEGEVPPPPELTPEEREARRRKRRKHGLQAMTVALSIVAIIVGVMVYLAWEENKQAEIARRAELVALSRALTEAQDHYVSISNNTRRIRVYAEQCKPIEEEVQASVELIIGRKLTVAKPSLLGIATETEEEESDEQDAPEEAAANGDEEPEAEDEATEAPAEDDAAEEQIEEEAEEAEPEHAVVAPATLVLENIMAIYALHEQAEKNQEKASALREKVRDSQESYRARSIVGEMGSLRSETEAMHPAAREAFDVITFRRRMVRDIRTRHERRLAAIKAAEEEARRRREEQERLERERREYEAQTARELEQVKADRENVKLMFHENNFKGALESIKQSAETYTTAQGKAAIQAFVDRYTYLVQMQEALITGLTEAPLGWGWGFGSTARDIERADANGIYVKGTAKPYPWSEVNTRQMLKLVDHYMEARVLRPRPRIQLAFGAAIYCDKFGSQARERARFYANRAMDFGLRQQEFRRLMENLW